MKTFKKLLSCAILATLMVGLPSLSMAKGKGKKGALAVSGKVTAVADDSKSITIEKGKKKSGKTETITVPDGTPIKDASGAAAQLKDLVGKHVTVKESAAGTASEIIVKQHKGKKKKNA